MEDIALLLRAVRFAAHKHRYQRRKDEDASPYLNHLIEVAEIMANVGNVLDLPTLLAAVLHDTVEDTDTTFTYTPPPNWTLERRLEYLRWAAKVVEGCRGANASLECRFYEELQEAWAKLGRS